MSLKELWENLASFRNSFLGEKQVSLTICKESGSGIGKKCVLFIACQFVSVVHFLNTG